MANVVYDEFISWLHDCIDLNFKKNQPKAIFIASCDTSDSIEFANLAVTYYIMMHDLGNTFHVLTLPLS